MKTVIHASPIPDSLHNTPYPHMIRSTEPTTQAAALAAAVALSNPLRQPKLRLQQIDPADIAFRSHQLGTTPAVVQQLAAQGQIAALAPYDLQLAHETLARNVLALPLAQTAAVALESAGIRCMALKGLATLLDMYSGNIGIRKMFDIDLMIDAKTWTRAHLILLNHGWTRVIDAPATSRINVEAVFTQRFGRPGAQFTVKLELHRRLTFPGRFRIPRRDLWSRAIQTDAAPSWRLDPVDALLYLAIHKIQHGYWNDCRDLVDATNIIDIHRPSLDWDVFLHRARRWGATAAAWLFLHRIQRAFNASIPHHTLRALRPSPTRARLLDAHMPDATLDLHFQQRRAFQIPLPRRLTALAIATDFPDTEAAALSLILLRQTLDRLLTVVPGAKRYAHMLDALPLPSAPPSLFSGRN